MEWRRMEVSVEETKLQHLWHELAQLEAALERLDLARRQAGSSVLASDPMTAEQLQACDRYRAHVAGEMERVDNAIGDCRRRIEAQRRVLLAARQRLRSLEQLKERRLAEWQRSATLELENLASELFLAKWVRGRQH
jgi:flagellar export protein FliJ